MSPPAEATVPVRGLGKLDASVYRRWVMVTLVAAAVGYGLVFALNVTVRGWGLGPASQLLAFARKEIIQPVAVDRVEVVHFTELGMRHLLGASRQLGLRISGEAPPILADRSQPEQVIFNLVKSVGDALGPEGRVEISVASPNTRVTGPLGSVYEVPAGFVELRISDNGDGMDAATLEHALEPYFTTKAVGEGTGLGLSSALGIVTQSGGQVRVDSRRGAGTSVHVLWPVAPPQAAGKSTAGPEAP